MIVPDRTAEARVRDAQQGQSMKAELRHIRIDVLGHHLSLEPNLAQAIGRRFEPLGGCGLCIWPVTRCRIRGLVPASEGKRSIPPNGRLTTLMVTFKPA